MPAEAGRLLQPLARQLRAILGAAGLIPLALGPTPAAADEATEHRVEIIGGHDETGQFYRWTVRNLSDSPVVFVQFPHYRADTFFAPETWQKEFINRIGDPKSTSQSGVCRAWTDDPKGAIERGRTAEFGLRLARGGANRGVGTVLVRFRDGFELKLAGVSVPKAPTTLDRLAVPGGLAVILLIIWAMHRLRRGRGAAAGAAAPGDSP